MILIILLIPLINAVTITNGTSYNNAITNLTINCTNTYYADLIIINDSGITFNKFNRDNSATISTTFSIIESNKQYYCSDLPYFTSTTTGGTITSNLDNDLLVGLSTYIDPTGVNKVTYDSTNSSYGFSYYDQNALDLLLNYLNGNNVLDLFVSNGNNTIDITQGIVGGMTSCESAVKVLVSYVSLICLIATVIFLAFILMYLTGFMNKQQFRDYSIVEAITTIMAILFTITVGIILTSSICQLFT